MIKQRSIARNIVLCVAIMMAVVCICICLTACSSTMLKYTYNSKTESYTLSSYTVWTKDGTEICIPKSYNNKPVTSIGNKVFQDCKWLSNIIIPDSVTSIGERAFYRCSGFANITIPNGVTHIGASAFFGCEGLESIVISDSVTSIGDLAFLGCDGLKSVYYVGSIADWVELTIGIDNDRLINSTRYYYSDGEPQASGNYWHYVDGEVTVWGK